MSAKADAMWAAERETVRLREKHGKEEDLLCLLRENLDLARRKEEEARAWAEDTEASLRTHEQEEVRLKAELESARETLQAAEDAWDAERISEGKERWKDFCTRIRREAHEAWERSLSKEDA